MKFPLNRRADDLLRRVEPRAEVLRVTAHLPASGGTLWDFGVETEGGLAAGLLLARVCLADLGSVSLLPGQLADIPWPLVAVQTDHPLEACLLSQYAGWKIDVGSFFGMGSGPMRAAAANEPLFEHLDYRETCDRVVGVIESEALPTVEIFTYLAEKTGAAVEDVSLLVAPTASQAGNVQIVARSVETALHKLHELGFAVSRVRSAFGTAPLPPVATDFLSGLGRTNDAILYGGRVTLWVSGDDDSLQELGPQVPANSSTAYGQPFQKIFKDAGHDFYQIDPHLFSPAEVIFQNLDTGRVHRFGAVAEDVLCTSFGLDSD